MCGSNLQLVNIAPLDLVSELDNDDDAVDEPGEGVLDGLLSDDSDQPTKMKSNMRNGHI